MAAFIVKTVVHNAVINRQQAGQQRNMIRKSIGRIHRLHAFSANTASGNIGHRPGLVLFDIVVTKAID